MTTKHGGFTPGPWHVLPGHAFQDASPRICPDRKPSIAAILLTGNSETDANAALIADAPRMYAENMRLREALKECMERVDAETRRTGSEYTQGILNRARAALEGDK